MALETATRKYTAGTHLYVLLGVFFSFFLALGVALFIKRGDWSFIAISVGGALLSFALLRILLLEISRSWFKYRNLTGTRTVMFGHVADAYIEVTRYTKAPQGIASFWIQLRNGDRFRINLRTFPVEAAAVLFSRLNEHGVVVTVPDKWAARRMAEQIYVAQAKLAGRA